MNERLVAMTDAELGLALASLEPEWPEAPDVAPSVAATIRAHEGRPSLGRLRLALPSRRRTLLLVAAVLLLIGAAALAAKFVLDLGAVTVHVVVTPPTSLPTTVFGASDLGRAVPLEEAGAIAGFEPVVPIALGRPDRVWVDEVVVEGVSARRIAMAWLPGPHLPRIHGTPWGAVLILFQGDVDVATKSLEGRRGARSVIVDGLLGFWIASTHPIELLAGKGVETFLVTGPVLLWQRAEVTYRLEVNLSRAAAIRIASSIPD